MGPAASTHALPALGAATFLQDLALALGVAAVVTVVFRRLRQPVVLGYLVAGVIVGPYVPIPLFADVRRVHVLSEIGVVLVMFAIGLELRVQRLARLLPTAGVAGLVQVGAMTWLGHAAAEALGWNAREAVFAGAMVAISSTMVIARTFGEQKTPKPLADTVFGILVFQDLAAIVLLAILTPFAGGRDLALGEIAPTATRLALFLAGTLVVGFLLVPRAIRAVARLGSRETLLVAAVGIAFGLALLAREVGYSVALGAFLAGSLVAESGEGRKVEHLVAPLRDVFAAIFFVSVGMTVDPRAVVSELPAILVFSVVVIVGQLLAGGLGAFLSGADVRTSIRTGMSLGQIGEFSFILAGVGAAGRAIGDFLVPVSVAVAVVTTFTTPWSVRASDAVSRRIERALPRPIATFASLYGSWIARLRAPKGVRPARGLRRAVALVVVDGAVLAAILVGTSVFQRPLVRLVARFAPAAIARAVVVTGAIALGLPFLLGLVRLARRIGETLAASASATGRPARALSAALALGTTLLALVPLLAVTQPFLPGPAAALLALGAVSLLALLFWRNAEALDHDVRAGVEVVAAALARQGATAPPEPDVEAMLPGLRGVRIAPRSELVGRTLAEIDLHGRTGATVVAVRREHEAATAPSARAPLEAGDVLVLVGELDAVASAVALLEGRAENEKAASPNGEAAED